MRSEIQIIDYKIQPLVDLIIANFRKIYTPDAVVVVDESIVPFQGRLFFRQYIPTKAHKYGLKIYKLCTSEGYTWSYLIYSGESEKLFNLDVSGSIVVKLSDDLLDEGRLIITDNFYTSIPLAMYMKSRGTDLCGTIRTNRKGLPKDVMAAELKQGEIAAQQKGNITVLKWKDRRNVHMLSTCHNHDVAITPGRNSKPKPLMILDYNKGKKGIDLSDQLASYYTPIRKTIIWYKKIAADLLCISIINSVLIYNEFREDSNKLSILSGQEQIVKELLQISTSSSSLMKTANPSTSHFLTTMPRQRNNKIKRKRCSGCYAKKRNENLSSKDAGKKAKMVSTECTICNISYCMLCFKEKHT